MLNTFTVSFFGHRDFYQHFKVEKRLEEIVTDLLNQKGYVEFIIGRNGEFDRFAASVIRRTKKEYSNGSLLLCLPYMTAEYKNNQESFEGYYDEIEICENAASVHFKGAIQKRNHEIVDRSDLIVCYIERQSGGAYQTIQYARKQKKEIINLAYCEED